MVSVSRCRWLLLSAVCMLVIVTFSPFDVFAQKQETAEIISPAPESTLDGSTATFAWSAGSQVKEYFLYLGTIPGANDLYGLSQGLNHEVTVSGLPVNGSIIYIRLWSLLPAGWLFNDTIVLAAEKSSGGIDLARKKLKDMNELLDKAINDYKNGVIDKRELSKRIAEIEELKLGVADLFPDVWGYPFGEWYRMFHHFDAVLYLADKTSYFVDGRISKADVVKILEMAKESKKNIEEYLKLVASK